MRRHLTILFLLAIALTSLVIADAVQMPWKESSTDGLPASVERIETCVNGSVVIDEPIYTTCTQDYIVQECDHTNTTCINSTQQRRYSCQNGTQQVTHTNTNCKVTGYVVGSVAFNTTNYACTASEDGKLYLTCDSVYDGNGDGICTSGESCVRFGIVGGYVVKEMKNSRDDFVDDDSSFVFVQPQQATVEEVAE